MQLTQVSLLLLFLSLAGVPKARAVRLDSRAVSVPESTILGATFLPSGEEFAVQSVLRKVSADGRDQSRRVVSLWSGRAPLKVAERDLGPVPRRVGEPCGRIVSVDEKGWLIVCSAGSELEILKSATLATERWVAIGQYIYDFAADEMRDRIYVVSYRGDGSTKLTAYSLSDGKQQEETTVDSTKGLSFKLLLDRKSGQVVLAETYEKNRYWRTRIYLCSGAPALSCSALSELPPVNQMDLLGRQLLFVGGDPMVTNSKRDCVNGLNLDTKAIGKEYCAEQTGVRFAVGVAAGRFVIGYTGTTKHLIWDEMLILEKSSLALWNVEGPHVAATLTDGSAKGDPRHYIVASHAKPTFLLYNSSNLAFVTIDENE